MRKRLIGRVALIALGVFLIVLLFIARLYSLQIVNTEKYRLTAERQYVDTSSGIYDRGNIATSHKGARGLDVASVRSVYTLAIDPSSLEDVETTYNKLTAIAPINKDTYDTRARKTNDPYEELAKGLSEEDANALQSLNLPGVMLIPTRERYYPGGSFAAHVLGFVAYDDNNERVGRYGVERYYEDVLARDSSNLYVNFFAEIFADLHNAASGDTHHEGDVQLTIDHELQVYVEQELEILQSTWRSQMVGAIVMDPQTGAILAMAANPTFNLNDFSNSSVSTYTNPFISNVYEMGSIIKVLTMAIGLDSGAVAPESTYNDTGSMLLNGATFSNYDGRARGVVPMQEVLSQSLNIGATHIAQETGAETFREYIQEKLRLDEETGIDLPSEAAGMVHNLDNPRDIELATASFGQGVAFTPIATLRALSASINGGYLVQPHIVRRINYTNGLSKTFDYSDQREQVFSAKTSEEMNTMLTTVVDEALRGGEVKLEHHSLGAKTGTAQLASESGGYRDDAYLHTFFGYGPAYNPRFAIFIMNLEPQGARYSSETLTEPFINMAQFTINHFNIPPDR